MRFRRWVVFTFLVHLVVVVVDKCAGFILVKLLEDQPDVKGAVDMLSTLPFILMAIANLGLATSLVYHIRKRLYPMQQVAETVGAVAWLWGGFAALMAYFATRTIGPWLKPEWSFDPLYVAPVCACIPLLLTTSYFNSIQLAADRIRDFNIVHLVASLSFLPMFFGLYWLTNGEAVSSMAYGRLLTALLVMCVVLWLVRDMLRFRPRVHWPFLRDGLTYGWRANITSVLTYLNHRIDIYYVAILYAAGGLLAGDDLARARLAEVAFYSLAVSFAELVWHFPEAMRDLFFSKVAGQTAKEARWFTPTLTRLCLWVSAAGGLIVWLMVDPVMTLIMPEMWGLLWKETVTACVAVLLPGTVFYTVAKILQNDLAARGHLNLCIAACVLTFVVMTGLGILWIPEHGAVGAAYASTIAYCASALFSLFAYRRTSGVGRLECLMLQRDDLRYLVEIARALRDKIRGGFRGGTP